MPARPRVIEAPVCLLLVVPDLEDGRLSLGDRELLGAARRLADGLHGAVAALAFAPERGLAFGIEGVDRVLLFEGARFAGYAPETRSAVLHAVAAALTPRHVLLPESLVGGDLGRRLATRLGEPPAFNIQRLAPDRVACRGDGGRSDFVMPPPRILIVAPGTGEPMAGVRHEARSIEARPMAPLPSPRIEDRGLVEVDANAVPLAEADFIVSGGNGVTDWDAFHRVAAALRATEGGSRVVVDAGFLPRDRQIGASGTLVEPRCYLAFGIAGAPQHLQGIARCERVIAVNTDLHAEMVKRADLAIIADAQAVMPALERRVLGRLSPQTFRPIEEGRAIPPGQGDRAPMRSRRSARQLRPQAALQAPCVGGREETPTRPRDKSLTVTALLSIGRHPASGRSRRAARDARALELALRLQEQAGADVEMVHAGDPDEPALCDYLGMSNAEMTVIEVQDGADPTSALVEHLRQRRPDLLLTGSVAETGPCSGFLPYLLAEKLGAEILPAVVEVEPGESGLNVVQALPRGRRRALRAELPLVVTVDLTAASPRGVAYGRARRGRIEVRPAKLGEPGCSQGWSNWSAGPARLRTRRLQAATGASVAERLRALSETQAGRGHLLVDPTPDEAAEAIYQYLVTEGIVRPGQSGTADAR